MVRKQAMMDCLSWKYDQSGVVATLHLGEVLFLNLLIIKTCFHTNNDSNLYRSIEHLVLLSSKIGQHLFSLYSI